MANWRWSSTSLIGRALPLTSRSSSLSRPSSTATASSFHTTASRMMCEDTLRHIPPSLRHSPSEFIERRRHPPSLWHSLEGLPDAERLRAKWDELIDKYDEDPKPFYKFCGSKEMAAARKRLPVVCEDAYWKELQLDALDVAKSMNSPFILAMPPEDHLSVDKAFSRDGKELLEHLRACEDIKFYTFVDAILKDKRLEKFKKSLSMDEIRSCILRHLYILTLKEVLPLEKRYMEHAIKRTHEAKYGLISCWQNKEYHPLSAPYVVSFRELPSRCLARGIGVILSRLPFIYKYDCMPEHMHKEMLRKVKEDYQLIPEKINEQIQEEMLRKLEEDYLLISEKINEVPITSEEMMEIEIQCYVAVQGNGIFWRR